MQRLLPALALLAGLGVAGSATAFCGFFVAKADGDLYNHASKVVLARNGDQTVITMANDYEGTPSEFAMVVPVPTVLGEGDVKVLDAALIDHLDSYSAPRLAEYHDSDPCYPVDAVLDHSIMEVSAAGMGRPMRQSREAKDLGVTVEARYDVEEYDVLVLSAKESGGLVTWLKQEGYTLPEGAEPVLQSYIRDGLRFFVAKVDLSEHKRRGGTTMLRPLQVRYTSPRFMLPIRLGTVNAKTEQDLLVFALTPHGRVETSNYRTVKMPTDLNVPTFVKNEFGDVYRAAFEQTLMRSGRESVITEYAWPLSVMCDPCSADPVTTQQLELLGATWVGQGGGKQFNAAFLTRLHVRYDRNTFVEDLRLVETRDAQPFQGRYVVTNPWGGEATCDAATAYWKQVRDRRNDEVNQLMGLTGWGRSDIVSRMDPLPKGAAGGSWYLGR